VNQWPTFFIVGAPKAGTTSLYSYLRETPGVFMSAIKEPHFFAPETATRWQITRIEDEEEYLALFRQSTESVRGEASAAYLRASETPRLIQRAVPEAQIVICLREPAERAFSHYLMRWRAGDLMRSLEDYLASTNSDEVFQNAVIEAGLYAAQVERYMEVFGKDRVKVLFFEDLVRDPGGVLKDLLGFLGVSADPPRNLGTIHNEYFEPRGRLVHFLFRNRLLRKTAKHLVPRWQKHAVVRLLGRKAKKPEMSAQARAALREIYLPEVRKLERLIDVPEAWGYARSSSSTSRA
jgi:hypothetical protein